MHSNIPAESKIANQKMSLTKKTRSCDCFDKSRYLIQGRFCIWPSRKWCSVQEHWRRLPCSLPIQIQGWLNATTLCTIRFAPNLKPSIGPVNVLGKFLPLGTSRGIVESLFCLLIIDYNTAKTLPPPHSTFFPKRSIFFYNNWLLIVKVTMIIVSKIVWTGLVALKRRKCHIACLPPNFFVDPQLGPIS